MRTRDDEGRYSAVGLVEKLKRLWQDTGKRRGTEPKKSRIKGNEGHKSKLVDSRDRRKKLTKRLRQSRMNKGRNLRTGD